MCLSHTFLIECIDSFALRELAFLDMYASGRRDSYRTRAQKGFVVVYFLILEF